MIKYNPRAGAWYSNELYFSPAYQSVTNSARNLFHCMLNELKWRGTGRKRDFTNNGEISLTGIQFKKMFNKIFEFSNFCEILRLVIINFANRKIKTKFFNFLNGLI